MKLKIIDEATNFTEDQEKRMYIKKGYFKCKACERVFKDTRTDEETKAEMKKLWGDIPKKEQVKICDSCFKNAGLDKLLN